MRGRVLCVIAAIVVPSTVAGAALAVEQQKRFDEASADVAPSIADGSAQRDLDQARARWRMHGPRDYTYRARLICFCTTDSLKPHTFVVRNRKPRHRPPKGLRGLATGWRLFRLVQAAIDDRVDGLHVKYRRNGLLKELDVDQHSMTNDDEFSYVIDRFSSP